jgi:hypothetical protein
MIVATYPIAESDFIHLVTGAISFDDADAPDWELDWVYENVALPLSALTVLFGWDRVVIIFQDLGQFRGGLLGSALGTLRDPRNNVPVVVQHLGDDDLIAHELGHTLYLWHPHSSNFINPIYAAQRYWVSGRIYEELSRTVMSYDWILPPGVPASPVWIDKSRYDSHPKTWVDLSHTSYELSGTWMWNLYDQFRVGPDPPNILIRARAHSNGSITAPDPWYYRSEGTPDLEPGTKGTHYIVLKNAYTDTLARMGFNVSFTFVIDHMGNLTVYRTDMVHLAFTVPYVKGTALIRIEDAKGTILYARRISANSPEVEVTHPNGGEFLKLGETHKLTWKADDLDGDPLSYAVSYSNDGGATWAPLAITLEDPVFLWNTEGLSPGRYRIRVMASDGFNTGDDVSDRCFIVAWILGDVDGDGDVDFDDIVAIAMAYQSKPGYPNWNPLADLDCDNDVDFDDVVTAAMNYMKTAG